MHNYKAKTMKIILIVGLFVAILGSYLEQL